ncbi:MAG TPA: hypothetical protein VGQ99_10085 [Tepidisphaeraceae bacterium]|jgi:hypothetical protein|nr:hypothetical protein [Tepidisphaeraceae bacterium]
MTETFLVLLAAGVMLAAVISDPKEVTINWLRLAGIVALALAALSVYFFSRRGEARQGQWVLYCILFFSILGQIGGIHLPVAAIGRPFALAATVGGVILGARLAVADARGVALVSSGGIAAMSGIALMDMLLGHAYLTASRMTMRPFVRLHLALAAATALRAVCAIAIAMLMLHWRPIELFWDRFGLFVITRWLVGLAVPGIFIYMAYDCIRRRATQSATGILYVAGILIFIGEIISLYLLRETRLPF